mmetsp:Transcript_21847/g.63564  ORF Transcript_21847/g.63564 Transcript_21847/m.63564 type:complete len:269 (+) Transcript_21847:1173-1979(+)
MEDHAPLVRAVLAPVGLARLGGVRDAWYFPRVVRARVHHVLLEGPEQCADSDDDEIQFASSWPHGFVQALPLHLQIGVWRDGCAIPIVPMPPAFVHEEHEVLLHPGVVLVGVLEVARPSHEVQRLLGSTQVLRLPVHRQVLKVDVDVHLELVPVLPANVGQAHVFREPLLFLVLVPELGVLPSLHFFHRFTLDFASLDAPHFVIDTGTVVLQGGFRVPGHHVAQLHALDHGVVHGLHELVQRREGSHRLVVARNAEELFEKGPALECE